MNFDLLIISGVFQKSTCFLNNYWTSFYKWNYVEVISLVYLLWILSALRLCNTIRENWVDKIAVSGSLFLYLNFFFRLKKIKIFFTFLFFIYKITQRIFNKNHLLFLFELYYSRSFCWQTFIFYTLFFIKRNFQYIMLLI